MRRPGRLIFSALLFFPYFSPFSGIFLVIWRRLKGKKGVNRHASPYRLKNYGYSHDDVINFLHYRYGTKFMDEYQSIMTRKLGLTKYNKQLISKLLNNMAVDKVDYTNFFRLLSNIKVDRDTPENKLLVPIKAALLDIGKERKEAWISWVQTYIEEVCLYLHSYKHMRFFIVATLVQESALY
jgi:hypothetical protein